MSNMHDIFCHNFKKFLGRSDGIDIFFVLEIGVFNMLFKNFSDYKVGWLNYY